MSPRVQPRPLEVVNAEARERAKVVYRALRDAGEAGLTRDALCELSGLDVATLLLTIGWIRFHKVDVQYRRSALVGDPNRFVLGARLPDAWDQTV